MTTLTTHLDLGCIGEQQVIVGYLYAKKDIASEVDSVTIYSVMFDKTDIHNDCPRDTLDDLRSRCFEDYHARFGGRKCTTS